MVGYLLLLRQGTEIQSILEAVTFLMPGGASRYGLGRLKRLQLSPDLQVFGMDVTLKTDGDPLICRRTVYAHAQGPSSLRSSYEMVVGWENATGKGLFSQWPEPLWIPGSTFIGQGVQEWKIEPGGFWAALQQGQEQKEAGLRRAAPCARARDGSPWKAETRGGTHWRVPLASHLTECYRGQPWPSREKGWP